MDSNINVKKEEWVDNLLIKLQNVLKDKVVQWATHSLNLSCNPEVLNSWEMILLENVRTLLDESNEEMEREENKTIKSIEKMLQRSEELCRTLSIRMPEYGKETLSLYEERDCLIKNIAKYESIIKEKTKKYDFLESEQIKLCECLGKRPLARANEKALPTEVEFRELEQYVETLENEKFKRTETFLSTQREILLIAEELELQPRLSFERIVFTISDPTPWLKDADIKQLEALHDSLITQAAEVKAEISSLRTRVEELWKILDKDMQERDSLRKKYSGNSVTVLSALKDELRECQEMRKANMQVFVKRLRQELVDMWDKCHFTEEERDKFESFYTELYNEDVLELHERELRKVTSHYNENKKLFALFESHQKLWDKLLELEEKAENPDRFKNRGGQLLQEEKERNKLSRQIPKIEEQMRELAQSYYEHAGKNFLFAGMTVDSFIDGAHEKREATKKLKMSARKQHRENLVLTPGKACLSTFPSSSKLQLVTSSVHKRRIDASPAPRRVKRTKLDFKPTAVPKTAPPVLKVNGVPYRTKMSRKRRSSGKHRRRVNKSNTSTSAFEYTAFEEEMDNKGLGCRSTLFGNVACSSRAGDTPLAKPLTPKPLNTVGTPESISKMRGKLTAACDLKLMF